MRILRGKEDVGQLLMTLDRALCREDEDWKPTVYKTAETAVGEEIVADQRNSIVRWLLSLYSQYQLNPETFTLSVSFLDRFLRVVKARPKYLNCIAITCYFLAAKCLEEDEVTPTTSELVEASRCGCSVAEILRMEKIILCKLNWELMQKTSVDFLHTLHALLLIEQPKLFADIKISPCTQLSILTRKLLTCLCNHQVMVFKPSVVALCLLSLELSTYSRDWLGATMVLQKLIKLENTDLIRCREVISRCLARHNVYHSGHLYKRSAAMYGIFELRAQGPKAAKRKVEQTETDDDVYDSIKRLYGDEAWIEAKVSSASSTCASQVLQEDSSIMATPVIIPTAAAAM